jgi:hypothetical protein
MASMFHQAETYIPRYFAQVEALRREIPVTLYLAEGDSADNTRSTLGAYLKPGDQIIDATHGQMVFGSVDRPERWKQVAFVCNLLLDALPQTGPLIYVESDLIWTAETMLRLLADLDVVDAVAPLCFQRERFYDTWGFRWEDGTHIGSAPARDTGLVKILSAGSCIAMRPEVYRDCRFSDDEAIVGLCREMRAEGFEMWMDTDLAIEHP